MVYIGLLPFLQYFPFFSHGHPSKVAIFVGMFLSEVYPFSPFHLYPLIPPALFRHCLPFRLTNMFVHIYWWSFFIPVVPARGGAEVALKIYIRPFSSIELACAVRQPSPCVRALCETGVLFHMSHLKLHFALRTSHCSLHTPHYTLHTPHFTLHS